MKFGREEYKRKLPELFFFFLNPDQDSNVNAFPTENNGEKWVNIAKVKILHVLTYYIR